MPALISSIYNISNIRYLSLKFQVNDEAKYIDNHFFLQNSCTCSTEKFLYLIIKWIYKPHWIQKNFFWVILIYVRLSLVSKTRPVIRFLIPLCFNLKVNERNMLSSSLITLFTSGLSNNWKTQLNRIFGNTFTKYFCFSLWYNFEFFLTLGR